MRLRHISGSEEIIKNSPYVLHQAQDKKEMFSASCIHLEIGMGKGQFLMTLARAYPQIHYIGIERYSSVLLRALQKMEQDPIPNLRFLCMDAKDLPEIFTAQEVEKIYLNFSDPWPKDRHAKRRLVSKEFLAIYACILRKGGEVEFKTDNRALFDFALEELKTEGWQIGAVTYDLHHDANMCAGNIMTEYEEKFSAKGNPIMKLNAKYGV